MQTGYLMVFRELHDKDIPSSIDLTFLQRRKIEHTNQETNATKPLPVEDGSLDFVIENAPGYLFLKYEIQD